MNMNVNIPDFNGENLKYTQEHERKNKTDFSASILLGYTVVGAFVGSTVAGSFLTGAKFVDVALSMNGALGAVAGLTVATFLGASSGNESQYLPLAGAIAVPAIVGMKLDMVTVGLGVGAFAGAWSGSYMYIASRFR